MRLRRHAEARDWVVVGEVFDHTPTATPLEQRTNWSQARAYITTGQARGIVTTSRTTCAQTSGSSTLMEWLRDQHAFLSEDSPTEAGAAR
ncbi:hypothetical protein ACF09H_09770 [Streptomyces sp. NPDC014983]|uniref:hypothetical protein n=1 Tax=Streptomyces sp. NPDC014983 TaxID=3364933 RepID=UPI0037025673